MADTDDGPLAIYRRSLKPRDTFFNNYVARPPAALFVWALRGTPITPNQVTFSSLAVFAVGAVVMMLCPSRLGLVGAVLVFELSYVLDCVDGQLARYKQMTSAVGALLDFLMDEIKAFLLIGSVAMRLRLWTGGQHWIEIGLAGLFVAATGISLTSFMRRPEYLEATGAAPRAPGVAAVEPGRRSPLGMVVGLVEKAGQFVLHYPSWIYLPAAFERIDLFLWIYLGAHTLYLGRASLMVLVKLGRFRRTPAV